MSASGVRTVSRGGRGEDADVGGHYIVGLDLAQAKDYTALAVVKQIASPAPRGQESLAHYHVGHLERFRNLPYPDIVARAGDLVTRPELVTLTRGYAIVGYGSVTPGPLQKKLPALVVDATGVGRPVVDMLRTSGLRPIPITITGGKDPAAGVDGITVPKRDLVATVQILLQTERLKIAEELLLQPVLRRELLDFQVRIDRLTAHDSYGAWREGAHDDLVLAVALALWYGERCCPRDLSKPYPIIQW